MGLVYFHHGTPVEVLSRKGKSWRVNKGGQETKIPSEELEPETQALHDLWQGRVQACAWAESFITVSSGRPVVPKYSVERIIQEEPEIQEIPEFSEPRPHLRHSRVGVTAQNITTGRDRFTRGPSGVTTSRGHIATRVPDPKTRYR